MSEISTHRLCIHGLSVVVHNQLPALDAAIVRALGEFSAPSDSDRNSAPTDGTIKRYEKDEVLKHLSPTAQLVSRTRESTEIYQDEERFWLIDDRWGLAEINLLKGQWRCWVIDEPAIDLDRVVEVAIIWPIAQLLRGKSLCILPATSVVRGDTGVLLISPVGIEPELTAMLRAGYRLLGQSWSALRETDGQINMLHMPGRVERAPALGAPRMRSIGLSTVGSGTSANWATSWVDLESEFCGSAIASANCTSVVLVEAGRRPTANLRPMSPSSVLPALRRAWPIAELHPHRVSGGQMPAKISRKCAVFDARLSTRATDFLDLLQNAMLVRQSSTRQTSPRQLPPPQEQQSVAV